MKKILFIAIMSIFLIYGCLQATPSETKKVYYAGDLLGGEYENLTKNEENALKAYIYVEAHKLTEKYKTDKRYLLGSAGCLNYYVYDFADKEFKQVKEHEEEKITELRNKYYQVEYKYKIGDYDYTFLFEIDLDKTNSFIVTLGYYDVYAGNSNAKIVLKKFKEVYTDSAVHRCEYDEYDRLEGEVL